MCGLRLVPSPEAWWPTCPSKLPEPRPGRHPCDTAWKGAKGVKLEGGQEVAPQIQAILQSGIPCVGHLGMLPQRVVEEGGYRIKGRSEEEKASFETQSFWQSWESVPWCLSWCSQTWLEKSLTGFHSHHRYWIWG